MAVSQPFSQVLYPAGTTFSHTTNSGVTTGQDIDTSGCQYLTVYNKATNVNSTGSIIVTVQGKDAASGDYYTLLAGASIASATTQRLKVGPQITAATNIAQDYLPRTIRLIITASSADVVGSVGIEVTG